jgi:alpha-beta hydrolase superfamily lysophospholipase
MRRTLRWLRAHPWRGLFLGLLISFVLLNILAYRHARAMTHFVESGKRTGGPQGLTLSQKVGILFTGVQIPHPGSPSTPPDYGLGHVVYNFAGTRGKLEGWYIRREQSVGTAVLFHGYAECKAQLLPEAKALHAMGYSCFLVDFPGSGGSEGDETTIGYREAEDVDRAVQYVREQWPGLPVVLFGRSMGSAAILRALAVEGTRADAAVLECPFDHMLSTVEARFAAMGVPSFPCAELLLFWGSVQLGFNGFNHNPSEYAAAVNCPVLLLHGEKDPNVSAAQTAAIFQTLGGPKKLHTFSGLGHEPYLWKQSVEWKAEVGRFLLESLKSE